MALLLIDIVKTIEIGKKWFRENKCPQARSRCGVVPGNRPDKTPGKSRELESQHAVPSYILPGGLTVQIRRPDTPLYGYDPVFKTIKNVLHPNHWFF